MNEEQELKGFNGHRPWIRMKYFKNNITTVYADVYKMYIVSDFCNFAFYGCWNVTDFKLCGLSEINLWMTLLSLPEVEEVFILLRLVLS